VSPDDIAQIQYTSGTTGFPKGAELHHRGLTNNARFFAERMELRPGEVYVNPMPLFHTAGCAMGVLGAAQSLATHVPVLAFDPALVLELFEAERAAVFAGVPTMMIAMLNHPDFTRRDLSSLRAAVSGGSPVPAELVRRVEELTRPSPKWPSSASRTRPGARWWRPSYVWLPVSKHRTSRSCGRCGSHLPRASLSAGLRDPCFG
jgi:acyl-CoA synthetase (AMP-forming)/AMP-acid ligase II